MKAKEDVDLPEVIIGNFSFHGNNIHALIDLGQPILHLCSSHRSFKY